MATTQEQLSETIQQLGETFESFKGELSEQVKAKASGDDLSAIEGRLEKMNDRFDELETIKSNLEKLQEKSARFGKGGTRDAVIDEHRKAFEGFVRKGDDSGFSNLDRKAVSVGSPADGGYAVPETLDAEIEKLERDESPMMGAVRVINVSNEEYRKLVSTGGSAGGIVGETDPRPETASPGLASITPDFTEAYANPSATQKSIDDLALDVESWLAEESVETFAEIKNFQLTAADGSGNNLTGLMARPTAATVDDVRPFGTIQHRLSGAAGVLGADSAAIIDNLIDLELDLKARYRNGASYMLGTPLLRIIRKLKDADGNLIWQQSLIQGQPSTINAYPYLVNEDMPDPVDGANSLSFGNFRRAMTMLNVRGRRVLRDPYTNKPFVHFYMTERYGSMLVNSEAVKHLQLAA